MLGSGRRFFFNTFLCFFGCFCVLCSVFFLLNQVSAQTAGDIAQSTLNDSFVGETGVSKLDLGSVIAASVTIILSMLGIIFFVLAIYAGFLWTTAQGDEGKIGEAKQTIVRASLGFFVVISSYALTSFVVGTLTEDAKVSPNTQMVGGDGSAVVGCCLDRISATGRPGSSGLGMWADRMSTQAQCSFDGENPNDPGDVRYGPGTWEWIGDITDPADCEAARMAKVRDDDRGSDDVGCASVGGTCQSYNNCKNDIETTAAANAQSCGAGMKCCIPKPECTGGNACKSSCTSNDTGQERDQACTGEFVGQKCCIPKPLCSSGSTCKARCTQGETKVTYEGCTTEGHVCCTPNPVR